MLASMATLALAELEVRPSGLKIEYISVPETCEQKADHGSMVSMHFTSTLELEDGTRYENRIEPVKFQIGQIGVGQKGVLGMGMCVGEKRRLIIPSELVEINLGGATLFYDIELLKIEDSPALVNGFTTALLQVTYAFHPNHHVFSQVLLRSPFHLNYL